MRTDLHACFATGTGGGAEGMWELTPVLAKNLRVSSSCVAIIPLPPMSLELTELLSSQTSMHTRTPSLAFFTSKSPAWHAVCLSQLPHG